MKKRILAVLLAVCLVIALMPTAAFAVGNSNNYKMTCRVSSEGNEGNYKDKTSSNYGLSEDTLQAFLGVLSEGKFTYQNSEKTIVASSPVTITVQKVNTNDTIDKKVVITATQPTSTSEDELVIYSTDSITIKGVGATNQYTHTITFSKGLEIQNGATLTLTAAMGSNRPESFEYTFSENLVVDGTLNTSGQTTVSTLQKLNFSEGSSLVIGENGTVALDNTSVSGSGSEDSALITNNGTLTISKGHNNGSDTTISATSGAAIVNKGTLTLERDARNGTLTISASGTAIVNEGTMTLEDGAVQSTTAAAITVAEGATLVIPEDSNAEVTTQAEDKQAIDLAGGATVKKGDLQITVSEANAEAGDNYVDNYGNIILAANPSEDDEGTVTAAKIILDDGTTIEGSEDEPLQITYKADEETSETVTQVTVPAGGSVQQPDEDEAAVLPGGGTVDGEKITVNVAGVSLSETSKTLSIGDTVTLTATVSPEDATNTDVVWSSSDEKVATVDMSGKVTAVGYGKAVITAKVGDIEATCTVIVPAPYIPPVNPNPSYSITAPTVDNGTLNVTPSSATKNTDVTITVTPDKDYELASLTVTDANGNRVPVKQTGENKFTFTMPASKVTVSASFSKVVKELPFTDVSADDYFFDAVVWAVENGVTYGNTATTFGVGVTCNRADAVTFIWRAYGCPAPKSSENPFTDVADSAYYADAVLWAVENGITVGTSATTFSPLESCRREHIVTFLYRAAGSPTVSHSSGFADVADSAYYANAVTWAAENGITVGAGSATTFGPTQNCFREQIVTFLYRNLAE